MQPGGDESVGDRAGTGARWTRYRRAEMDGDRMDTLSDAMRRLQADGYTGNWYATDDRMLHCDESGAVIDPTSVVIDHILRFEGQSDPGDAAILFALRAADGARGIYSAPYGAQTPREDADVIALLQHRTGDGTLEPS